MAGYDYAKFVSDFGNRTLENCRMINAARSNDISNKVEEIDINHKHYEVTQLINSMFGMIIVPYEKYKFDFERPNSPYSICENDLKETKEYYKIALMIIDLEKKGKLYNDYNENYLVSAFIKHLRNALAHSGDEGLHFTPVKKDEAIKSIIFYDNNNDGNKFCTELTIGQIRILIELVYGMYKNIEHYKEFDDLTAYGSVVNKHRQLMKVNHTWARKYTQDIRAGSRSKNLN